MKYDFETIVDRTNTGSLKWDQMFQFCPNLPKGIVPFSVADMEIKNAPEIIEGLKHYLDTAILGYTGPTDAYFDAVCGWMKKRHNWDIKKEWIVGSPGVVPGFYLLVRALTKPGDGVIIQPPVYYPFYSAIEANGRTVVKNTLIFKNGRYEIDYDDLERKARDKNNKVLLFCSPHNPVGRVWTKEELGKVGDICLRNNVIIISDEIHNDLIMPGKKHTVFATLSDELANSMAMCTAPSKTFSLAGLQTSNLIIPNEAIRNAYLQEAGKNAFMVLNAIGYKACEIAYTQCEKWLDEVMLLIDHNRRILTDFIEKNIPIIKVIELEGTYLQWLDFRGLGLGKEELEKRLHEEAFLFFDEGYVFGDEGVGFERWNLACPSKTMMEGLERLATFVKKVEKEKR